MKQIVNQLLDRFDILAKKIDALPQQKRTLAFFGLLFVLILLWWVLIESPLQVKTTKSNASLSRLFMSSISVEEDVQKIKSAAKSRNGFTALEAKEDELKRLVAEATQYKKYMVPVHQITQAFEDVMKTEHQLTIKGVETFPAKVLKIKTVKTVKAEKSSKQKVEEKITSPENDASKLYQYDANLLFTGNYFSTMNYLKDLESHRWQFFWDSLDYEVTDYPQARVTLKFHVLHYRKGE